MVELCGDLRCEGDRAAVRKRLFVVGHLESCVGLGVAATTCQVEEDKGLMFDLVRLETEKIMSH